MTRPSDWNLRKEIIIKRDNSICQICKKNCLRKEIDIDHKVPFGISFTHDLDNLWCLCRRCHREKNKRDQSNIARFKRDAKIRWEEKLNNGRLHR